jgi:hypothetical protein
LTGNHWRDLSTDVTRLKELGVETLLRLVEDAELQECRVINIATAMDEAGIDLIRFPIRDRRISTDVAAFHRAIRDVAARVRSGAHLAIACRGGLDRSGMAAACLLIEAGIGIEDAIGRVHSARRGSLTFPEQLGFVKAWRAARS